MTGGQTAITDPELRATALDIANTSLATVNELRPSHIANLTQGQDIVFGLHIRCRYLFRGICLLLDARLPQEVSILSRTLLADSVSLGYLRLNVGDLETLALRFIRSSIHEELALAYAARGAGGERLRAGVEELKDQQHRVERDLLDRGVKPRSFPKLPAMLKAVEQESAYWNYKLGSMAVHTSRLALEATRERGEDGVSTWSDEGSDRSIASLAHEATHAYVAGALAAAEIMGWPRMDEVLAFHESTISKLDALAVAAGWVGANAP